MNRQLPTGYRYRAAAGSQDQVVVVGDSGSIFSSDVGSQEDVISLGIAGLTNTNLFKLSVSGVAGHLYGIEASTNLVSWTGLTNVTLNATSNVASLTLSNAASAFFLRGVNP
jgi:hypothetical protein